MSKSLRGPSPARSVLLRMAQDQERAERIRQLKLEHPEMTWNYIGEKVGVRERSAAEWQKSGGISPDNAKKLAKVFGVSYEWLWFGEREDTPDLMAVNSGVEEVGTTVEDIREEFRGKVDEIIERLDTAEVDRAGMRAEITIQNENLEKQTLVIGELRGVVADLRRVVAALPALELLAEAGGRATPEAAPEARTERDGAEERRHGDRRTGS